MYIISDDVVINIKQKTIKSQSLSRWEGGEKGRKDIIIIIKPLFNAQLTIKGRLRSRTFQM